MDFIKKNDFIVKHKKKEHFDSDLELFKKHCPNSKLHDSLKRVNSFNKSILDGQMLYELLDKVSPEEILKFRGVSEEIVPVIPDKVNALKNSAESNDDEIQNLQEALSETESSIGALETEVEALKKTPTSKKKVSTKNSP